MIFGATPPPSNVLAAIMLFYLIWLVLEGFWAKKVRAKVLFFVLMGTLLGTIVIVLVAWTEFCYKFSVR
jgi:hypothetical protein